MNRFFLIVAIFYSVVEGLHISRQLERFGPWSNGFTMPANIGPIKDANFDSNDPRWTAIWQFPGHPDGQAFNPYQLAPQQRTNYGLVMFTNASSNAFECPEDMKLEKFPFLTDTNDNIATDLWEHCNQDLPDVHFDPYGNRTRGCKPSRKHPQECDDWEHDYTAVAGSRLSTPSLQKWNVPHVSDNRCCFAIWVNPADRNLVKNVTESIFWTEYPDDDHDCSGMPIRTLEIVDYCTESEPECYCTGDADPTVCLSTRKQDMKWKMITGDLGYAEGFDWRIKTQRQLWPDVCYKIKRQQPEYQYGGLKSLMCSYVSDILKCDFYNMDGCIGETANTKSYPLNSWNRGYHAYYNHSEANEMRNAWALYMNGGGHHSCFYSYADPMSLGYNPPNGLKGNRDYGRVRETTDFLLPFSPGIFHRHMDPSNHPLFSKRGTVDQLGWTPAPVTWTTMYGVISASFLEASEQSDPSSLEANEQKEMLGEGAWRPFGAPDQTWIDNHYNEKKEEQSRSEQFWHERDTNPYFWFELYHEGERMELEKGLQLWMEQQTLLHEDKNYKKKNQKEAAWSKWLREDPNHKNYWIEHDRRMTEQAGLDKHMLNEVTSWDPHFADLMNQQKVEVLKTLDERKILFLEKFGWQEIVVKPKMKETEMASELESSMDFGYDGHDGFDYEDDGKDKKDDDTQEIDTSFLEKTMLEEPKKSPTVDLNKEEGFHDSDIFEDMSHWEEPEEFDLE